MNSFRNFPEFYFYSGNSLIAQRERKKGTPARNSTFKKSGATALAIFALLISGLVTTAPAQAAVTTPNPDPLSFVAEPGAIDESNPALPAVLDKIKQAGGGGVIATWEGTFAPVETSEATQTGQPVQAAAPAGCQIYGIVYFTQRWTSRSSVYNDGNTYCPGAVGISMNLGILKENTIWSTVSRVAYGNFRGNGPEIKGEVEYICPTGSVSGFSATADGTLTLGGTVYGVVQKSRGFQRFNCG